MTSEMVLEPRIRISGQLLSELDAKLILSRVQSIISWHGEPCGCAIHTRNTGKTEETEETEETNEIADEIYIILRLSPTLADVRVNAIRTMIADVLSLYSPDSWETDLL